MQPTHHLLQGHDPLNQNYRFNWLKCKFIECAYQTQISWIKRTTYGGTPLFLFQQVQREITVPYAQNSHFHSVVFLYRHYSIDHMPYYVFWSSNETAKYTLIWNQSEKKAFPFDTNTFLNFQPKIFSWPLESTLGILCPQTLHCKVLTYHHVC